MTDTFFVADVGNTRIKVGKCASEGLSDMKALRRDVPMQWRQVLSGSRNGPNRWTVAGVDPTRRERFATWLRERGDDVRVLTDYRDVPIRVDVDAPEKVGIDRLLDAVAVVPHIPPGRRAVVIDAGTAVTVDLVEREGVFRGGAIFPGLWLMARALRDHTAQLPLVEGTAADELQLPGRDTSAAIRTGVYLAVFGGIDRMVAEYERTFGSIYVVCAGGDAERLRLFHHQPDLVNPWLTLEGLRRTILHQS
jgi:type III pantothenate kinase